MQDFILFRDMCWAEGSSAPSDKLNIASIGIGGKGGDDIKHFADSGKANIAFLCDVDEVSAADTRKAFPMRNIIRITGRCFQRKTNPLTLFLCPLQIIRSSRGDEAAMQLNKHVYVQKPLTHDIYEARILTEQPIGIK